MSLISIPYTFSAGAVIIASQHNSNFSTIATDYNGNIDNNNISASAAISYSKLNLSNSILNADINSSAAIVDTKLSTISTAGKVNISALTVASQAQGDVIYASGATTWARLGPGTSGQFLKTQGASANPVWGDAPSLSNVLFQYAGQFKSQGTSLGEYSGTSLVPDNIAGNYRFLQVADSAYTAVFETKFIKIQGVSTVTIYAAIWTRGGAEQANIKIDIGTANGNVSGTVGQATPEWKTFTIDVSGLSNGTVYTVTGSLKNAAGNAQEVFCGAIIAFGS